MGLIPTLGAIDRDSVNNKNGSKFIKTYFLVRSLLVYKYVKLNIGMTSRDVSLVKKAKILSVMAKYIEERVLVLK